MFTFISNTRSVSASGSISPKGSSAVQNFQNSNGSSNVLDDYNCTVQGTLGIASAPALLATAKAAQTSKFTPTTIVVNGTLDVQSRIDPQGQGTATALASSNFEVSFSVDAPTNFVFEGLVTLPTRDDPKELRKFLLSINGVGVYDIGYLANSPILTDLKAGDTVGIIFDLQVGAKTDPTGDRGTCIFSFSCQCLPM